MKNTNFTSRLTTILTVNELGHEFEEPEKIMINVDYDDRNSPLDFGSLAYSERKKNVSSRTSSVASIQVNIESLIIHRRNVLNVIFDRLYCANLRGATVVRYFHVCRLVFQWLEDFGLKNAFGDLGSAQEAYQKYSDWLSKQVIQEKLSASTASTRQLHLKFLLFGCFPNDHELITRGVVKLRDNNKHHPVPKDEDVKRFVEASYATAKTFSDFIINGKSFPFILNALEVKQYIFPFKSNGKKAEGNLSFIDMYCSISGCLEEMIMLREKFPGVPDSRFRHNIKLATMQLSKYNDDMRCIPRMHIASTAVGCYILLIQLITGISLSELRDVRFDDVVNSSNGKISRELVSIKHRAGGKKTRYLLGKLGRKILSMYLRLRKWILNGAQFDYLFFIHRRVGTYFGGLRNLHLGYQYASHERLCKLFPSSDLKFIGSSLARKYKSLVFHGLGLPIASTAKILNHTVETNANSYSETLPDVAGGELEKYWAAVRAHADKIVSHKLDSAATALVSNGVGSCKEFLHPVPAVIDPPISPDCTKQFGCLYCVHYSFHADREDVHKLLSLQYVINEIREVDEHVNYTDKLLVDLFVRIETIINKTSEISRAHFDMVTSLKRRVFEFGELTLFWDKFLSRVEIMRGEV